MKKIKIFTHTDLDGIGCAIVAKLAFDEVDVEYCDYKDVNGKVREFYLNDGDKLYDAVYITDISVDDEVAEEINQIVSIDGKWKLFDHHATALNLNKYSWCLVSVMNDDEFETKTSGTELFYKYLLHNRYFEKHTFYVKNNLARFVEIVRDYDTWRWKEELGEDGIVCKQVNDIFHIYGRDKFIDWSIDKIRDRLGLEYPNFDDMDKFILEQKQKDIDIYIAKKNKQLINVIDNFGYTCGVVFAERFFSELGNKLSELHPELDYIAMIDISYGGVSYRTTRDDIDLGGEIAHSFGGGGHRKAAGSTFDAERMKYLVMNDIFNLKNELIV